MTPPPGKAAEAGERGDAGRAGARGTMTVVMAQEYSLDFFGAVPRMNHRSVARAPTAQEGIVDFTLTPDQQAFRERVRTWLEANIPREWKALGATEVPRAEAYEFLRRWQRKLFDAGFIGLTWPKEYGGQGLTFMEEMILHEEMALREGAADPQRPRRRHGRARRSSPTAPRSRRSATPRRSSPARRSGARATRSPTPAPTWPRCRRAR